MAPAADVPEGRLSLIAGCFLACLPADEPASVHGFARMMSRFEVQCQGMLMLPGVCVCCTFSLQLP